ncbi:hypothetical protein Tco_0467863 [Tanacetum coccineum]
MRKMVMMRKMKVIEDLNNEKDERKWQSMVLEMKIEEIVCSKREVQESRTRVGAPFTQGTIPSISIGDSISPEGFLPSILLLMVIIVTVVVIVILIVVVVDDVSLILKLSFVIIGFLHIIMPYYLIH